MRRHAAPLFALLAFAACVPPTEALHTATLSNAPDAPGFLVIGTAEQNYRWDLAAWTTSLTLTLTSPAHEPVLVSRGGCGSLTALVGAKPCDLSQTDRAVLQLPPGAYTPARVDEAYHLADGDHALAAPLATPPIIVRPGQVTYAGDYTFASSAIDQSIRLVQRTLDPAAAQRALAPFPNLRAAQLQM